MGKQWKQCQTLFFWAPKSLQMVTAAMKLKDAHWKESYDQPRQHIQKQRHYFADKGPSSQSYSFSSSDVWMWELGCQESWAPKNWCFWTVVLEKTLESPSDCKEIQPVHPKEISPKYSLEGLMLKQKLQYFGHLIQRTDSLERPWCWKRLKAGGEGDNRRWDGWMASQTQWTWVWTNSGRQWRKGNPDVPQSVGSQSRTWLIDWTTNAFKVPAAVASVNTPFHLITK